MSKYFAISCVPVFLMMMAAGCDRVEPDGLRSQGTPEGDNAWVDPYACNIRLTETDVILNDLPLVQTALVTDENLPDQVIPRLGKHLRRLAKCRARNTYVPSDGRPVESPVASLVIDGNIPYETVRLVIVTLSANGYGLVDVSLAGSDSPPVRVDERVGKPGKGGNRMAVAMAGTESDLMVGYGANGMGFKGTGSGDGGTGGYGRIHGLGNVDTGGGSGMRAGLGKRGTRKVGQMRIDGMQGSGFCQKGNIEAVVKQRAGAIRACYEQELQLREGLAGKVAVRWTINAEGKVESASVTNSTIGSSKVESCIMTVIRRMRFAAPEGGICVVQWPFVFSPG